MWKPLILLPLLFVSTFGKTVSSVDRHGLDIIGPLIPRFQFGFGGGHGQEEQAGEGADEVAHDYKPNELKTNFLGEWKIDNPNAGVSAMQMQLMPTGKVVWFDTTNLGPSAILNDPPFCRNTPDNKQDCYAHAIEYDPDTSTYKSMKFQYDPWCSSGGLAPNGDLINTGGALEAEKALRILSPCDDCEFQENPNALGDNRWYASQQILEDGSFIVMGGRNTYSYEVIPPSQLNFQSKAIPFPFLRETRDERENNLYPFLYLLPDGNVFLFANSKSLILNPQTNEIVRRLPDLAGGSRNYPPSAMSALLPLKLTPDNNEENIKAEVIVCGGNTPDALNNAEKGVFLTALNDCNRIVVTDKDAQWDREEMPSPRVMGDMLILPNGDLLMHGGAKKGCSAWYAADEPNFTPVLYSPDKPKGQRMKELASTNVARMYHASSALLPDGKIIAAGSNPNQFYNFTVKYPTELRVEKFSPPYLAPKLRKYRPEILKISRNGDLAYGAPFNVHINIDANVSVEKDDIKVTMYAPPFTTHGFSQNQRLVILGLTIVSEKRIKAMAPPSGRIAPPGYYILFVSYKGVPSEGWWVILQ